ncbi:MAG: MBL fold metallo-hydrolase [Notoacmeibacter sp.]|nr:MBL fold metallo-hydrolase [Notoacmeibacter sp.]MCC0032009.1 MBL fold metallo-hydrolase [Brucellaceae bacterium]
MTVITGRRDFFKIAAGGAALLAMPSILVRPAMADMAQAPTGIPFSRFKLGDFTVTIINDGSTIMEKPQATFGTDQTKEAVSALLEANHLPADRLANGFAPTLVQTGSDTVLFDTGLGAGAREKGMGQTAARLALAGIRPEDVTVVVITHMHPDHIGGLVEDGKPAYPNARYVTGQTEYDFWADPARSGTPAERVHAMVNSMVRPLAERTTFIGNEGEVLPGIRGIAAPGHTPGHMGFHLESAGKRLMITGDTANHFVLSLQKPDWEVRFDMDKAAAAATRRKVFGMIAADRIPFIGYHMPFPAAGFVEAMEGGFRFIPESYQFEL